MSAPVHPTAQQIADSMGISRRLLFQAAAVHRYGCEELKDAAHAGVLSMKHCETLAKALQHKEQREFLRSIPTMKSRELRELLAILRGDLKYRARMKHGKEALR